MAVADSLTAEKLLAIANAVNPRDEDTLARLTAIKHLRGEKGAIAAGAKEVAAFDSKPAEYYAILGSLLSDSRQFAIAAECFEKAAALRPALPGAKAGLGLLYYTQGREAEALATLRAAMKADPFNVKVDNALIVLEELAEYATIETPHFVIRFDKNNDKVLAAFLADVLEDTFAEYAKRYGFTPRERFSWRCLPGGRSSAGESRCSRGCPERCLAPAPGRSSPSRHRVPTAGAAYNWAIGRPARTDARLQPASNHAPRTHLAQQRGWPSAPRTPTGLAVQVTPIRATGSRPGPSSTSTPSPARTSGSASTHDAGLRVSLPGACCTCSTSKSSTGAKPPSRSIAAYHDTADIAAALKTAFGVEKADFEVGYRKYLEQVAKAAGGRRPEKALTFAELEAAHLESPQRSRTPPPATPGRRTARQLSEAKKTRGRRFWRRRRGTRSRASFPLACFAVQKTMPGRRKCWRRPRRPTRTTGACCSNSGSSTST